MDHRTPSGEVVGDVDVGVLDERLAEQGRFARELPEPSGDDLLDDGGRLAGIRGLGLDDRALALHEVGRQVGLAHREGPARGDVHRDVLAGGGGVFARVDGDEDADAPGVGVAGDAPAGGVEDLEPPDGDVLSDPRDELPAAIIDGGAAVEGEGAERLDAVRLVGQHHAGDLAGELPEVVLAGDEVGLAVDLHHGAARAADLDRDQPLRGDAPRLAVRGGKAALAHGLDGGLEVAARRHERLLAVHHPGPGAIPERLHLGGGHRGHG